VSTLRKCLLYRRYSRMLTKNKVKIELKHFDLLLVFVLLANILKISPRLETVRFSANYLYLVSASCLFVCLFVAFFLLSSNDEMKLNIKYTCSSAIYFRYLLFQSLRKKCTKSDGKLATLHVMSRLKNLPPNSALIPLTRRALKVNVYNVSTM